MISQVNLYHNIHLFNTWKKYRKKNRKVKKPQWNTEAIIVNKQKNVISHLLIWPSNPIEPLSPRLLSRALTVTFEVLIVDDVLASVTDGFPTVTVSSQNGELADLGAVNLQQ